MDNHGGTLGMEGQTRDIEGKLTGVQRRSEESRLPLDTSEHPPISILGLVIQLDKGNAVSPILPHEVAKAHQCG